MPVHAEMNDTVFHRTVCLFYGSKAEFKRHLIERWGQTAGRHADESERALAQRVEFDVKDQGDGRCKVWYVWLTRWDGAPTSWATLCHECYHATYSVMEQLGVNDEETTAYYLDSMVEQFGVALTTAPSGHDSAP